MINGKNEKNNLKLMLADFCYFNRNTFGSRYTPLNIGLLAQYTNQEFGENISISLYKSVDKFLNQAKENPPDIVGLAVYYWNTALNQYVVKCLREMFGEKIVIVLGGRMTSLRYGTPEPHVHGNTFSSRLAVIWR